MFFSPQKRWRMQHDAIRSNKRHRMMIANLQCGPQRSVVKSKIKLAADLDLASKTLNDPDHRGRAVLNRQEINQSHGAALRLKVRFKDQRIGLISPADSNHCV